MSNIDLIKYLEDTTIKVSEHFDTVVIIATRETENGDFATYTNGTGNYHTRLGSALEYIEREKGKIYAAVRSETE